MNQVKQEQIYEGRAISVRRDTVLTEDGQTRTWDVVEHPGAVVVLAVDGEELLFVRQHRYAAGESLLELVAGTCEPGEEPAVTADRELQEEAGYKAGRLTKLAEFYSAPGFCSELLHLYLAEELTPSKLPGDEDEEIQVERIPLAQALEMAMQSQFRDAKTLVGVLLYGAGRGA